MRPSAEFPSVGLYVRTHSGRVTTSEEPTGAKKQGFAKDTVMWLSSGNTREGVRESLLMSSV